MTITAAKFYQGIKFGADTLTFINLSTENGKKDLTGATRYTVEEVEHGLLIRRGNLATLATWNNVAYVEYDGSPKDNNKLKKQIT